MSANAEQAANAFAAGILYLMKGKGTKLAIPLEDIDTHMDLRFKIQDNILFIELVHVHEESRA